MRLHITMTMIVLMKKALHMTLKLVANNASTWHNYLLPDSSLLLLLVEALLCLGYLGLFMSW